MPAPRRIVLLGATGSIGHNALRVIAAHPDRLRLVGIAGRGNHENLAEIARRFRVPHAALADETAAETATRQNLFPAETRLTSGPEALATLATLPEADLVLVAIVGTSALRPTLAAIDAGKDIALASKEILVLAGEFVMRAVRDAGVRLLPVDSEHNGVFQLLDGRRNDGIRRLLLTASGGAFRDVPLEKLGSVSPAEALRHPNWEMGPKITVDSATLANKGLELIEAQWLFGLEPDRLHAVLHPPSIVHALIEMVDGSVLAQMSPPNMTFAIQNALLHPERQPGVEPGLDFDREFNLGFRPVDPARYPCLELACAAMRAGGALPAVFNAANEVAVAAFLDERLPFLAISKVIEDTMQSTDAVSGGNLDAVLAVDVEARQRAREHAGRL